MAKETKSQAAHFNPDMAALNQKEVKAVLQATFRQGGHPMPICLCGAPGVGKSQIIQGVCREFGITPEEGTYHEVRLSTCVDSADITGLPVITKQTKEVDGKSVEWGHETTYSNPRQLPFKKFDAEGNELKDDRLHVLFFDEVNRGADPSIMNAIFQILTEYGVANHKLVDNCIILLAMNPENTGYTVNEMCPALVNRMNIQYMKAEVQPWLEWARGEGKVSKLVADFIDNNPKYFAHDGIITNEGQDKRFPTPRAWKNLDTFLLKQAHLRYKTPSDASFAIKMIAGYVGWQAATQFVSFARTAAEDRPLTGVEILSSYSRATDMQEKVRALDDNGVRMYDAAKTTATLQSLQDEFKARGTKIKPAELKNMLTFLADIAPEHALSFQNFLLQGLDQGFTEWFFTQVMKDTDMAAAWQKLQAGVSDAGVGNQSVL